MVNKLPNQAVPDRVRSLKYGSQSFLTWCLMGATMNEVRWCCTLPTTVFRTQSCTLVQYFWQCSTRTQSHTKRLLSLWMINDRAFGPCGHSLQKQLKFVTVNHGDYTVKNPETLYGSATGRTVIFFTAARISTARISKIREKSVTVRNTRKGYRKIFHNECCKITIWNCKIQVLCID